MGVLDLTGGIEGEDYFIYLNVVRIRDGGKVNGRVEIVDPDKLRRVKLAEINANEFISKSFSRSGNVEMICEIFGYKKVQHDFIRMYGWKLRSWLIDILSNAVPCSNRLHVGYLTCMEIVINTDFSEK